MSNPSEARRGRQVFYTGVNSVGNVNAVSELILYGDGKAVPNRGSSHRSGVLVDERLRSLYGDSVQVAISRSNEF